MKVVLRCATCIFLLAALTQAQKAIRPPASWEKLAAKAADSVNVNLDANTLRFAGGFMNTRDADEAEAKRLISRLKGIYVRSMEFKQAREFTEADIEPIRAQLAGWSRIVGVDSKNTNEKVEIYCKSENGQFAGMVILAQEPTELTFVHIDGPIDPAELGKLSGSFGIPKGIAVQDQNPKAGSPEGGSAPHFYRTSQPALGQVRIQTGDKDAEVYLNGAYAGAAQDLRNVWLEPGVYDLEVNSANHAKWAKKIYVLSGKTLKVRAEE
jgi:hypothetical protein